MTAVVMLSPADWFASQQETQRADAPQCIRACGGRLLADHAACDNGCDLAVPFRNWSEYELARVRRAAASSASSAPTVRTVPPVPADTLSRVSPDGRFVATIRRQASKTTPLFSLRCDGILTVSEELQITQPKKRDGVVSRIDEDARGWMSSALLELSEAWSTTRQSGTEGAKDASPSPVTTTSEWSEPVDLASVLDRIVTRAQVHLYLPKHVPALIALWVAATHTFRVVDGEMSTPLPTMPLFWAFSPTKGCGKSRTMAFLHVLSARSFGSENCSTSAAFRIASKYFPTLIFDEIDTWLAEDTKKEFIGFLNASFTRGGMFTRVVGDDHDVASFLVYGARAFAGIGTRLADATRSRSARAALEKKPLHIKVQPISTTSRNTAQWADPLRSQLARAIADAIPELTELMEGDGPPVPEGVEDRAIDAWSPLLGIADIAGDHWPATARAACIALTQQAAEQDEDEGDIGVRLLWASHAAFRERGCKAMEPGDLQADLTKDTTAPWADYRGGHEISTRAMAVLLRRFGIKARKSGSRRVYDLKDFGPALASYPEPSVAASEESSYPSYPSFPSHSTLRVGTLGTERTDKTILPTAVAVIPNDDGYWGSLLADESAVSAEEEVE